MELKHFQSFALFFVFDKLIVSIVELKLEDVDTLTEIINKINRIHCGIETNFLSYLFMCCNSINRIHCGIET